MNKIKEVKRLILENGKNRIETKLLEMNGHKLHYEKIEIYTSNFIEIMEHTYTIENYNVLKNGNIIIEFSPLGMENYRKCKKLIILGDE